MEETEINSLEERREALIAKFREVPDLMRGKISERYVKCGRPSCPCASGGPRHPGLHLTVNIGGRTRTRYVRVGERDAIEAKVASYWRVRELIEELTEVNLALLNARPARKLGAQEEEG